MIKVGKCFPSYMFLTLISYLAPIPLIAETKPTKIKIAPPGTPADIPPPTVSDDQVERDLNEKRRMRNDRNAEGQLAPPTPAVVQQQKLVEAALKPLPSRLHMSLTWAGTQIKTFGKKRQKYTSEPTGLIHAYIRPGGSDQPTDSTQLWTGFRLAPFAGSGVYEGRAANYGFTYFGPMIGLGKISSPVQSVGDDTVKNPDKVADDFHSSGFMWMSGIALQSRIGKTPEGAETPREDINTKGVAYDAPGIWTEISFVSVHYRLYSTNFLAGIQSGQSKAWIYLGMGFGFWY